MASSRCDVFVPVRLVVLGVLGLTTMGSALMPAAAQTPVVMPNTITTVAGGATSTGGAITGGVLPAKGAACSTGSPYTATDAFGDGCPGINTALSADFRGGLQVDGFGNVFIMDTSNSLLRKIDAKSGLVTAVTGTSLTGCTTNLDAYGDGCPLAQTKLSTARGVNVDPYGNVIVSGYSMQVITVVCNAISPLCPGTAGHKQVGSMYRIAGCVTSATATGTSGTGVTAGTSGDGFAASPYGNLSGDVTDWNPSATTNFGIAGYGANCTAVNTLGAVSSPRGVAADRYGNVYIAETGAGTAGFRYRVVVGPPTFTLPNGTVLTNPMGNIIALNPTYSSVTPTTAWGKIYPINGGFGAAATTIGGTCAAGTGNALDKIGGGCPYYISTSGASGQQGIGTDFEGNAIFADNSESIVSVMYTGPSIGAGVSSTDPMVVAIRAANNNSNLAVTQGYIYPIIGAINSGAANTNLSLTPTLGTTTTIGNGTSKVAIDPYGNIFVSDFNQNAVLFFDIKTGYVRKLATTGTACANKLDSVGDGCPVNQSSFGSGAAGMGIGINPQGDLYIADNTNLLIRKVTATNLIPATIGGAAVSQTEILHLPVGATGVTVSQGTASGDIVISAATCPAANGDGTLDCTVTASFAPSKAGQRNSTMLAAVLGASGSAVFPVAGVATGSVLAVDSTAPTVTTSGAVSTPVSLAIDGSGDLFTMNSGTSNVVEISGATTTPITGSSLPAGAFQIAADNAGNVYETGAGSSVITKLTANTSFGFTQSTVSYTPPVTPAQPYGIVTDRQGNLFVADRANETVYEIPVGSNFGASNPVSTVVASGITTIGELALDGNGDLFIADLGAGVVKRMLAGATTLTTVASSVVPSHIAADTAGNLYVQDNTAKTVTEYPLSGPATLVYSFTGTGAGIAIGGDGVVYEVESGSTAINTIQRQAANFNFGTNTALTFNGTFTNVGNLAATGINQTDTGDFQVVGGTSNPCNLAAAQAIGAACTVAGTFTPQAGSGVVSDIVSLLPAPSTLGNLTLTATKNGSAVTTTTTIGSETPASPVYVASGTEVSFTISVGASAGTASGSVAVTVDSLAPVNYNLNGSAQAVVALSGLTAGNHTISATYATQNGFTGSATSSPTAFSIAQAVSTLSWTPSATTQQFSAAIGQGVLNATASSGGVAVLGNVIYTATPTGGSATPIHSASYLPIGTYALAATFVPNDAVDFSTANGSVPTYTVTKATTTAAVGGSQFLVAGDGTGNYTSVQAAVNAVGASGGNIYIKPGTYTGAITVVQPNVALHGLGGDPTQVILTNRAGSFGGSGVNSYGGAFTSAQNNGAQLPAGSTVNSGDEASATLVVAKGINTAFSSSTLTPSNFYAENLSLINTYDSDNVNTTTSYLPAANSGVCAVQSTPQTYFALYNSSLLCASQALAVWIVADLSVMNNVYTTSLQDTIYAGSQGTGSNGTVPARQYWFRGKVTGDVDYIFGDAAAVFDYSTIYSAFHGTAATGTVTIEAQNKAHQTNGTGDYLSGYVMNSNVFTSQSSGMTSLFFGRPYGTYSTYVMLNSYVDQVNAAASGATAGAGYIEFSGDTNLPTSTYGEYNDIPYTDPANGAPDLNGVTYLGTGGSTGQNLFPLSAREQTSQSPGTLMASNTNKVAMTQAQAQAYFPTNFLSQTVSSLVSTTQNWNPAAAIASYVNAFVPSGSSATVAGGSSFTILLRPQTPGLGAVANGTYTIPTGTYVLSDTYNGVTTTLASGSLDASGEAYVTSNTLNAGTHSLSWTYSGDSNFSGSTTASAYTLTVSGTSTATTLGATTNPITYGQSAAITATVSSGSGTPTGSVVLTIDGTTTQTASLSGGAASFTVNGLTAGTHNFTASYGGSTTYANSNSSTFQLTVNKASVTVTASCSNRTFGQANSCSAQVGTLQNGDTVATVFTATPTGTSTATPTSPAGPYTATPVATLSTFGTANYTITPANGSFTVSGGAPQSIIFAALPNFPHGSSYQLTARTTSGLPVTYSVTNGTGTATVSGSTLTVITAGTITVNASQTTDPTGDYASATPVSRSFTAQ